MKTKKVLLSTIAAILFGITAMVSCKKESGTTVVSNVSFSKDLLPIFEASCAINSNCHLGSFNLNDHVDLTDSVAYTTIQTKGLVYVGTPTASILYNQVATGVMPKAPYSKLTAAQINLILNWIQQGAKNN